MNTHNKKPYASTNFVTFLKECETDSKESMIGVLEGGQEEQMSAASKTFFDVIISKNETTGDLNDYMVRWNLDVNFSMNSVLETEDPPLLILWIDILIIYDELYGCDLAD